MINDQNVANSEIMVVDDNAANLRLLVDLLGAAGYKVRPATTGELALRSAQAKPPTLILLDIKMPDIDGYEICRRLKADEKTSSIPIIFVTALEGEPDKVKGFQAGCVDYITKPIREEEALGRVSAHCSLRRAHLEIESQNIALAELNKQLESANRLFSFLSEVNQTIVRVKERDELFSTICRIAVEIGRFRMAWIGLVEEESGDVKPVTHHGQEAGYLSTVRINIHTESTHLRPTQAAIAEGKVIICDDVATTPLILPHIREETLKRGYRSFAVVPLRLKGRVTGNLNIYSEKPGFFTQSEERLLQEIGSDISFALDSFEAAKEHAQLEEKLKDSEARYRRLFETAQDAILILNGDTGQIIDANPFIKDLLGYSMEELLGRSLWEIGELKNTLASKLSNQELHRNGHIRYDHLPLVTKDGRPIAVEIVANSYRVDHTTVTQCNIRDITERQKMADALKAKDDSLRLAQENAHIGNWDWDPATGALYWSEENYRIFGLDPQKVAPSFETFLAAVEQDDLQRVKRAVADALANKSAYDIDMGIIRPDGTRRTVNAKARTIFDGAGKAVRMVGTVQDITDRKRAEVALRQSEETYKTLVESTNDAIYMIDKNGKILSVNASAAHLLHKNAGEIAGKTVFGIFPDEVARRYSANVRTVLETGDAYNIEGDFFVGEKKIWISTCLSPVRNPAGEVAAVIGVTRDITERKVAEEALRQSETRYRSLFEQAADNIILLEYDYSGIPVIVDINKSVSVAHGYSRQEIIGKPITFLNPDSTPGITAKRKHALATKGEIAFAATHQCKDGSVREFEVHAKLLNIGSTSVVLTVEHDLTSRKRAEQERQLLVRLESVGILAGGIAHDFNNLLTGILGNIQLAQIDTEPGSKVANRLMEAEKASLRARDLTQQLLTFSKGGAPVKKLIAIDRMIKDSATFAARGSKARCEFSLPDDLWAAEADEGQISQVINNLVINACQAMPEGGTIQITGCNLVLDEGNTLSLPEGKYIQVSVEDHGIGIPDKYLNRIFEPYFTTKEKGHGLGLAAAFSIIKNHGGKITVESKVGFGATFSVYLPASNQPAPLETPPIAKSTAVSGKGRILVMDDEETIRSLLSNLLTITGYEVELAKDGDEAVELYRKAKECGRRFDAVIMDLTIPGGMGGKEAVQRVLEIDPEAKVIVSSGYANDPIMAEYQKYGFSGVIAKPFAMKSLVELLSSLLRDKTP